MREYAAELNAPSQDEDSQRRKRKKEKKEEVYHFCLLISDSYRLQTWMSNFSNADVSFSVGWH